MARHLYDVLTLDKIKVTEGVQKEQVDTVFKFHLQTEQNHFKLGWNAQAGTNDRNTRRSYMQRFEEQSALTVLSSKYLGGSFAQHIFYRIDKGQPALCYIIATITVSVGATSYYGHVLVDECFASPALAWPQCGVQ